MHGKASAASGATPKPQASWLAGAAIGLTLLGMAGSAFAIGAGLALSHPPRQGG